MAAKGMFGGGLSIDLSGFMPGFMAGMGAPGGRELMQSFYERKMAERNQEIQEQQYQRQRQDGMTDWKAKQDYERANPTPRVNDTVADFEFIKQQLGEEGAKRYLETKTNPIVMTPMGPMPYSQVNPAAPTAPVGRLTPIDGGPTPPASAPFPAFYR